MRMQPLAAAEAPLADEREMQRHETALANVRDALRTHGGDGSILQHLRPLIQELGHSARHASLPPERVLVELKAVIDSALDQSRLPIQAHAALRAQLVSFTIDAYYGDATPAAPPKRWHLIAPPIIRAPGQRNC